MLARRFCVSRKGGTGEVGGVTRMQGAVHMAAVRLGCKSNMVGTGLANSHPGCMSRLRKCYCCLLRVLSDREGFLDSQVSVCLPRVQTVA